MVGIIAGVLAIFANADKAPKIVLFILVGLCLVCGLIGLLLDFKPWKWFGAESSKANAQADIAILLGDWSIRKPDLLQKWTFSSDRTVMADKGDSLTKGTWRIKESRVLIEWNSIISGTRKHHWATLNLPLDPVGTRGDAWDGQDLIYAVKTPAPNTQGTIP